MEAEALAAEAAAQHLEAFVRAREALGERDAEAAELVRRIAHAHADLDASTAQVVEHGQVLGEPHGMTERQQADVRREPDARGARGHGARDGSPRWQVAVLHEVVLGEPHEVQAELLQPHHLVEDLRVEPWRGDARVGRVAEVVHHTEAQWLTRHVLSGARAASYGPRAPD